LPKIIADKEIIKALSDTIISDKNHFLVSLVVKNKSLNGLGTFIPVTLQRNFIYEIIIDKDTYLPVQVIQTNNVEPKDYMLTNFSNYKLDNNPSDNSWYYSTYSNDFKPASEKGINLIKSNSMAPDWQLPLFATSGTLTLNELKGKVVLLEFWIKNCSYCIAAVPKLNSIAEKYNKNKKFEIVGVNANDTKEDVNNFNSRNKPTFKTVSDKGKVTIAYGVNSFPTVVLIDKKGKVLYSGNFDQKVLEPLIKCALR
jgi:thiol-disulfide isomerase/thioredoxin